MTRRSVQPWKANLLFGLLLAAVAGLLVRLGTVVHYDRSRAEAFSRRRERTVVNLPARPGGILAVAGRRYVALATSRQAPSCYADPGLITDPNQRSEAARKVAAALGADPVDIYNKLARTDTRFVWLARRIDRRRAEAIRDLNFPAVRIRHEWQRVYPMDDLAGQIVGFRRRADNVAGAGLELAQDDYLQAEAGRRVCLADVHRRGIWPLPRESRPARDGQHVLLHLDAVIQGYLEEAVAESCRRFGGKWAAGVVMDPHTGAVLAMCSAPGYNPNLYWRADADDRTNRAIAWPYEPGSVAKPLFAAAAVDRGLVGWQSRIDCEQGVYHAPRGGRISDHGHAYGMLTVSDIVKHSSNIGMAKIGELLGNRRLYETARAFGFGAETGIDLPGESAGQLRPLDRWDGYSLRRVPFGQEMSVTTLQLAAAYSVLANGGVLMRPRIIDAVAAANGAILWQSEPQAIRRVLRPASARGALDAMVRVIEEEGGTGRRARMSAWTMAGKTGTAQIAGPGGYVADAYVASFAGVAPAGRPVAVCAISVYWPDGSEGHSGGRVAAPYVKQVMERVLAYLDVPPDRPGQAPPRVAARR